MKKILFLILLSLFILSGCQYAFYPQTSQKQYIETSPDTIKLYTDKVDFNYEVIGPVAVEVPGKSKNATKYLKKKASKLGANAIIEVKLTTSNSFANSTGISGIAVKIKES